MGNQHASGKGPLDYTPSMMKSHPMLFHDSHSTNIQISPDKRKAKRIESFCKGICFGSRPVAINERVYIRFAEISTSWSGVLRFGFTAHDPALINPADLPRYACPDLTNKPGYWAKALPERVAVQGNILFFYITRSGECKFGLNNEEKGLFFNGIDVSNFLFPLVDIYGNTTSMEFVDGVQINVSESPPQIHPSHLSVSQSNLPGQCGGQLHHPSVAKSATAAPVAVSGVSASSSTSIPSSTGPMPVVHHASCNFSPLPFHMAIGRSICLSSDKTIAVRLVEEYCNGYVFTSRPLRCGEKLVIQVMSIDRTYVGGIAFGMTACDPTALNGVDLPDDSDLLLDRPEYWIVNKDVCTNPEVGDELSFHLTVEGQVIYGRNGHSIATLMHVDKTLPMWAFFDIYGNTQKIKCLGVAFSGAGSAVGQDERSHLHVSLPQDMSRNQSSSSLSSQGSSSIIPPRPPPPRVSPNSIKHQHSTHRAESTSPTPPQLPPKQGRGQTGPLHHPGGLAASGSSSGGAVAAAAGGADFNLPPPLIPVPSSSQQGAAPTAAVISTQSDTANTTSPPLTSNSTTTAAKVPPAIPPRHIDQWHRGTMRKSEVNIAANPGNASQEVADNASNECCVCLEKPPNSVLYTCGHMCMCYDCAVDIKNNQGGLCPMCRKDIKDIIKIYRS